MSTPTIPGIGKVLDFQEAKARLLNLRPNSPAPSEALSEAVERFAFSRLPRRERIAKTIEPWISREVDSSYSWKAYLPLADIIEKALSSDFTEVPSAVQANQES